MAKWVIATAALALSMAGIAGAIVWEDSIRPENGIPQVHGPGSYVTAGTRRLAEAATFYDIRTDPGFTVHIERKLVQDFMRQMLKLSPKLGWQAQAGGTHNDLIITLPASQTQEVERMAENPRDWIREKAGQPPVQDVAEEPLVNVTVDIDGFQAGTLWTYALVYAATAGAAISLMAIFGLLLLTGLEMPEAKGKPRRETY